MRKLMLLLIIAVQSFVFVSSCTKSHTATEQDLDCSTITNKNFAADINPIIQSTCNHQGCHDVASTNGPGPLTNYSQFVNARTVIRPAIASGLMPQNTTLSTAQRNAILCWIDSGAPNN